MENPLGFYMERAVVSWVASDTAAKRQKAARIIAATDLNMKNIIYDSGMDENLDSRGVTVPIDLQPRTRYYWTVTVEGDNGDCATSAVNWFETAKMNEGWSGKWISPPWEQQKDDCQHPYVRKQFHTNGKILSARAYITGMGIYDLFVNGSLVGDECFAPYCNTYDAWVQYQTYDITNSLRDGENVLGAMLANGWSKGKFGTFGPRNSPYTNRFSLICEIHITYEDGTAEKICTDESWLCKPSPVLFDNMYDGVVYDANKEITGWCETHLDTGDWQNMNVINPEELGELTARLSPSVKCMEEVKPIALLKTPAGETVLDMGQNMVGWLRMRVNAPKGTQIKITHGEILQRDNFYTENLRSAKQEYIYISDGTEKIVEPRFSFYGFRYAKVEGISDVRLEDFTGCVLYSNLETTGNIVTSDKRVNRLFQNAMWGQKGNFLDVPTDCPQRDERMGWTGDTQVFAGTAMFNMNSYAFYVKFMYDLYKEQRFCGGLVPSTVPLFVQRRPIETGDRGTGGVCAWSDCATIVPWEVYVHSGDSSIVKNQYQSMKDWVDWITRKCERDGTGYLWTEGFHFGDWLALDGEKDSQGRSLNPFGATGTDYLASAYYRYSSLLMSKAASLLGRPEDAEKYAVLSANVRKAILEKYFTAEGKLKIQTQTAHVIAIQFDLTDNKAEMITGLKKILIENNMHLTTGFIGTPFLCRVLSDYGESESAYQLFFNEDYPSWLYPVSMGATTIWERWNSVMPNGLISDTGMNSLNHYAYGSIAEWMYRHMCGINPVECAPGFKKILLKPEPNKRLKFANGEVNTAMGKIKCGWKYNSDGSVTIEAEVPFNTTAEIILPTGERKILEAGIYSFIN
jgi:alpha-L-rhamnosidase